MTAEFRMALLELLRKYQGEPEVDALREGLRWLAQQLRELEVREQIGAGRYERTSTRKAHRNGYRSRPWNTRVGTIELRIPKLRHGSHFPSLLERRRRAAKALVAVIQEAYVQGEHPEGGRAGAGPGTGWRQQERGLPALCRVGRVD